MNHALYWNDPVSQSSTPEKPDLGMSSKPDTLTTLTTIRGVPEKPALGMTSKLDTLTILTTIREASNRVLDRMTLNLAEAMIFHQNTIIEWTIPITLEREASPKSISGLEVGHFTLVIERILNLLLLDEEDEAERPSRDVILATISLLRSVQAYIKYPFPRAAAAANEDGHLYLYWRKPNKSLQITIKSADMERAFLYHQEGAIYGSENGISGERLAFWLDWFSND